MTDVNSILSADWSPKRGNVGEIVEDLADIDQCLEIICGTPKGSVPHRPLFGCDILRWIDAPPALAVPNLILEVTDALELWEPRVEVTKVSATLSAGVATLTIYWRRRGQAATSIKELTIGN